MDKNPIVHLLMSDGGEYPAESEYILCDPHETFCNAKADERKEYVTCKNCLRIIAKGTASAKHEGESRGK